MLGVEDDLHRRPQAKAVPWLRRVVAIVVDAVEDALGPSHVAETENIRGGIVTGDADNFLCLQLSI